MDALFIKLVNMSITAGWLVLAIIVLRLLLRKAPRNIVCLLWAVVAVRLVCPFSFESALSLVPSTQTISPDILYSPAPAIDSGISSLNNAVNPIFTEVFAPPTHVTSVNPLQVYTFIAGVFWIIGMAAMVIWAAASYIRLRLRIREAIETEKGVMICDRVDTPFIIGIFRPRIILPSALQKEQTAPVLAHERAHIKRLDHITKPLAFALLTVYWFNPLMWLAYILLCRDIELACDEKVIKGMDAQEKKSYTSALLDCSLPRGLTAACPLAFGEVGIKSRIKAALSYKKPGLWLIIAAVAALAVLTVGFLTDPKEPETQVLSVISASSELEGLSVTLTDIEHGSAPVLHTEWTNRSGGDIVYGEEFYIYRDNGGVWEDCRQVEYFWDAIANYIHSGGFSEKDYSLYGMDMSAPGRYRFETSCSFEGTEEKYGISIEFELLQGITASQGKEHDMPSFKATVVRVLDGSLLVTPFDGEDELRSADSIYVSTAVQTGSMPIVSIGDAVEIYYDGMILETYPTQIDGTYAIYLLAQ